MVYIQLHNAISASQARLRFYELLRRAELGEEITITRYGAPVARLTRVKTCSTPKQRIAAITAIRRIAQENKLNGLKIADLIDDGRR